jgi:site-specific recombinase XerD
LATRTTRRYALHRFRAFCQKHGVASPLAVTPGHVETYRKGLTWTYALNSQATLLEGVRTFFRWAYRAGRLLLDPTADLVLTRPPAVEALRLLPGQVAALLVPPQPATPLRIRNWAILETLYGTAIRRAECLALDLLDVNLRDGTLNVHQGKGRQSRTLPLGPHLASVLQTYLEHGRRHLATLPGEPALFLARGGQRLARSAFGLVLTAAGRRIGLSALGSHALRRACATHTLVAGADLASVQQLLGHATPDTTQGYVAVDWEQVKAEHARTHPRSTFPPEP